MKLDASSLRRIFCLVAMTWSFQTLAQSGDEAKKDQKEEEVSTLNNQLVKVGDRHEYLYAYKKWNVSTNPIAWIWGTYGLSVSYAFHSNFAVRGDLNYVEDLYGSEEGGGEFSLSVPVYFRKMYTDYFLEPGFTYQKFQVGKKDVRVYGPSVLIGHHWYWDSGLNISAALGFGRNWSAVKKSDFENADRVNKLFATGYLRFGYAF